MEEKKQIEPKRFYIGHALNIGEGVEEVVPSYVPVAISEYEDDIAFDEFSNQRVYIGSSLDAVMDDEFLNVNYLDSEEISDGYKLFVLKSTLVELSSESFRQYLKAYLVAPQYEEIRNQLLALGNSTIRWRKYLKMLKDSEKVKIKK